MRLEGKTPREAIDEYVSRQVEAAIYAVVRNLAYIGEQVVNHARSLPSPSAEGFKGKPHQPNYIDWSANLRSSIGYVVVIDGKVVTQSSFEPVRGGTKGSEEGRKFANSLSSKFPEGIALVVVAGMEYAQYVSAKGYDVTDSSEVLARRLVPDMLRKLGMIK